MKYIKYLLFITILIMPFMVNAASGTELSGFGSTEWTFENNVLTIRFDGDKGVIYHGASHQWSEYSTDVKKIVLEGINIIGNHNFENYPNLEEVVLDDDMAGYIGDYAFYNCPKLKHIDLPSSGFSRIGKYAFYDTGITKVEIPIFLSWIDEHAFPDDTNIIYKKDELNILDAGTAGKLISSYDGFGEGKSQNNTCYNKFYFGNYYDNTAKWILYNDGTLLVYGTDLFKLYSNSRVPWGCYKKLVKKVIINNDKTGIISINDKLCKTGNQYKVAVYASKPIEDIMNNRIKKIDGNLLWDCREECELSSFNIDTYIFNRGVEEIISAFLSNVNSVDRDIYINKYVKKINEDVLFETNYANPKNTILHVDVSVNDYINNNYSYKVIGGVDSSSPHPDILDGDHFILHPPFISNNHKGEIINDIDDTYVSINDNSVAETIEYDGKTYYKYETYLTNKDREVNVSLPVDDTVDYIVKEVDAPQGCSINKNIMPISMRNTNINLIIEHKRPNNIINPETSNSIIIVVIVSILAVVITTIINSNSKIKNNS